MPQQQSTLKDLLKQRARTLEEIRKRERQPLYVKAQFSCALDSRLARINRQIAEAKQAAEAEMPERLQRLNREMAIDRTIDHDTLYLTKTGYRFETRVFKAETGFYAATKVGGFLHRYNGATPAEAVMMLGKSLDHLLTRLGYDKTAAEAEMKRLAVRQDQPALS